jgi:glutathione S-transferase
MDLVSNGMSPFGRKVMIVVHELGLGDRVRLVEGRPREDPETVFARNPLGKIPVLVTDDGAAVYDSAVISEYLDAEFGGHRLLPAAGPRRWEVLTTMAGADGVIDAAILVRNERLRPEEQRSPAWIDRHLEKVRRGLDALDGRADDLARTIDLGTIAAGCAADYVPRRLDEFATLGDWPRLRTLRDDLAKRPSFAMTVPDG